MQCQQIASECVREKTGHWEEGSYRRNQVSKQDIMDMKTLCEYLEFEGGCNNSRVVPMSEFDADDHTLL